LSYFPNRFESGKTFSNIFYPEKDDILKRINFFTENKAWYKKRGIPYTMGFLLYGEPGCGKTSTIKAIANHTQRHIVSVPLNKIKSGKELLNVFYNVKMNCKDIPLNKRLYVLEDIDCADLKDIVKDRGEKDNKDAEDCMVSDKDSDKDSGLDLLSLLKVPTVEGFKSKNRLTLATLLEVLDGVMEMEGRMLVITTNYPEKLDKALIRPGTVFGKISLHFCKHTGLNYK
jgi:chaperone BCS1